MSVNRSQMPTQHFSSDVNQFERILNLEQGIVRYGALAF